MNLLSKPFVSPKQVAKAIGVSESTVKRWCDGGLLRTTKTAGGHRKIEAADAINFAISRGYSLEALETLGLPAQAGRSQWSLERAKDHFRRSLVDADQRSAHRILVDLMMAGHSITRICDDVIAVVFHELGDLWEQEELSIYQERRSCDLCLRVLFELQSLVRTPSVEAPVAIGATLEGDFYTLAATMAEVVLKSLDWSATLLGSHLPIETLLQAIDDQQPKLFWVSVSYIADRASFTNNINQLFSRVELYGGALVVGGRELTPDLRNQMNAHCYADNFRALEMYCRSLHPIASEPTQPYGATNA